MCHPFEKDVSCTKFFLNHRFRRKVSISRIHWESNTKVSIKNAENASET